MTESQAALEARIRRVLDRAAGQVEVRTPGWQPPSPAPRRSVRPDWGTLVAVACALVALVIGGGALVLLRHGSAGAGTPGGNPLPPAPATAFEPHLTGKEGRYIGAAWSATVARDRACRSVSPELTTGTPSRALTSRFGVLRLSAKRASKLRAMLHDKRSYGGLSTHGNFTQALYLNQIHLARTAFGAGFYVIPAGNVSGQRGVPARCGPEQVARLRHEVADLPHGEQSQILAAQRRYLAFLRYQARHPEGVCATFVPAGARHLDLADNLGCSTLAQVGRWGIAFDAVADLRGDPVFWTVVPDGVRSVTLHFHRTPNKRLTTIVARPVRNLVVAAEPHGVRVSGKGVTYYWSAGFPATIVLRGRSGRVLKRATVTPNIITLCGYGC